MPRPKYQPYSLQFIERVSRVLGDTEKGLSGSEITMLLHASTVEDVAGPNSTKWRRLVGALSARQYKDQSGNCVIRFITEAMDLVRYHNDRSTFDQRQAALNEVLVSEGLRVNDRGRVARLSGGKALTLDEAASRAGVVHSELERRDAHEEMLRFCTAELFAKDNFHAVLEATKSISQRLRDFCGLSGDGSDLVDRTLLPKDDPLLAINDLADETACSEQAGLANIIKGLLGMYRSPTAHVPRIHREVSDEELYEAFSVISMIHRRLDTARTRERSTRHS